MLATPDSPSLEPAEGLRQAFLTLATGLLEFRRNELRPTSASLDKIYQASWTALLRCMFIGWCEWHGVLPADGNGEYARYHTLRNLTGRALSGDFAPEATRSALWGRLRRLWQTVGAGKPELGVPRYEGTLFDDELQHFPVGWRVGDDAMVRFLRLLALLSEGDGLWSVPTLSRQLAALLDQQLQYATVPTSVLRAADGRLVRSTETPSDDTDTQAIALTLPAGTLYLQTGDVAARYPASTPEQLAALVRQRVVPRVHTLLANLRDGAELLAGLRLQDPALDGGVTLCTAATVVAQELAFLESSCAQHSEQPEARWLPRILAECCSGAAVDLPTVELSRLTLRLAAGAPFVFKGEQAIQQGNGYLGARLTDLQPYFKPRRHQRPTRLQLGLWSEAGGGCETLPARDTVYDRASLLAWRELADVWTAQHVGLDLGQVDLRALARYLLQDSISVPGYDSVIRQARARAHVLHFFHPELSVWDHLTSIDDTLPDLLFLSDPQYLRRLTEQNLGRQVPARTRDFHGLQSWQPGELA